MKETPAIFGLKNSLLKKIILFLPAPFLTMLDTMKYSIFALLILIGLDLITALVSYFYQLWLERDKKPLTFKDFRYKIASGGLRETLKKYYIYSVVCIVTYILEMFVVGEPVIIEVPIIHRNTTLTEFVIWVCALIEVKSIDENLEGATGKSFLKSMVDIIQYFKNLVKQVKK